MAIFGKRKKDTCFIIIAYAIEFISCTRDCVEIDNNTSLMIQFSRKLPAAEI